MGVSAGWRFRDRRRGFLMAGSRSASKQGGREMRIVLLTLLLCWVAAAADLAGTWDVEVIADSQTHQAKMRFASTDGKWSGTIASRGQEYPMKAVKAENDVVSFEVDAGDHTVKFNLKVSDDGLE